MCYCYNILEGKQVLFCNYAFRQITLLYFLGSSYKYKMFSFQLPQPQSNEATSDGSVQVCVDRGMKGEMTKKSATCTNSTHNSRLWLTSEKSHGLSRLQLTYKSVQVIKQHFVSQNFTIFKAWCMKSLLRLKMTIRWSINYWMYNMAIFNTLLQLLFNSFHGYMYILYTFLKFFAY